MVETKLLYTCEICGEPYNNKNVAVKCETEHKEFQELVKNNPIAVFYLTEEPHKEPRYWCGIAYPPFKVGKFERYPDNSISAEFGKLGMLSIPSYEAFLVWLHPDFNIIHENKLFKYSGTVLRSDIGSQCLEYERENGLNRDSQEGCKPVFIGKERIIDEADLILKKLDTTVTGKDIFGIIEALKRGEYWSS